MDACIKKGAAQVQEAERTAVAFSNNFTDVNLKSDIFLRILSFLKSRKYEFIRTCIV